MAIFPLDPCGKFSGEIPYFRQRRKDCKEEGTARMKGSWELKVQAGRSEGRPWLSASTTVLRVSAHARERPQKPWRCCAFPAASGELERCVNRDKKSTVPAYSCPLCLSMMEVGAVLQWFNTPKPTPLALKKLGEMDI